MKTFKFIGISLLFFLGYTSALRADVEPIIREIVVFGESTSDTGNVFDLTCADLEEFDPPCLKDNEGEFLYYNGRLSNGPIWIDRLADWLGVADPAPSRQRGSNYAHAGAKSFFDTNKRVSLFGLGELNHEVPQIGEQITRYLDDALEFQPDQLVVIFGGANDLRDIQNLDGVTNLVEALTGHVRTVIENGATQVLVLNQLPANKAPIFSGAPEVRALIETLLNVFNPAFEYSIKSEKKYLRDGVRIHFIDAFGITLEIINRPQDFGLSNVTDSALDFEISDTGEFTGAVVPNPEEYLFWDLIHPTAAFYKPFAALVLDAIANNLMDDLGQTLADIELVDKKGKARARLERKLNKAKTKVAGGKLDSAVDKLEGFKDKVRDLADDGRLNESDAIKLEGDADYLIGWLSQIQS